MRPGERQVAPTLKGIRRDHLARYEWAAKRLVAGNSVIDLACGVGYGAHILAKAGMNVLAIDNDAEAIAYAEKHYADPRIRYACDDASNLAKLPAADAAVCFETIEHVKDPLPFLKQLYAAVPLLLASVPNEDKFPWKNYAYHFRHYTRREFADLLVQAGFEVSEWWGQAGPESEVANVNGRTLVVVAKRASNRKSAKASPPSPGKNRIEEQILPVPERVAIVALGPSLNSYVGLVKRLGARSKLCDEVWGVNALGDLLQCDRVWHMDDVRVQEIRAAADPNGNIAAMLPWLKRHPGPVYTSRAHPDYPGLVEFPLAEVLNSCGGNRYFNSTPAYAVAYAIHIGVKKILCFGMDYTLPNAHDAEKGRACVEFWLGFASARGIELSFPKGTTLHDACVPPAQRLYGYDTVNVEITGESGDESVLLKPRDVLPTAEEIEARYDHSQHPNAIVATA